MIRIRILLDHLAQLRRIIGDIRHIAELFLDGLELFAQEVLLLALINAFLDFVIDVCLDLREPLLLFQLSDDHDHALIDIDRLKQLLFCRRIQRKILGKLICQRDG